MTAHGRWEVFRGESIEQKDLLFSVKQSSLFQLVSSKLHVFLPSNTTESVPDFRIEGAFIDSSCTIYLGNSNTIVAQVSSKPILILEHLSALIIILEMLCFLSLSLSCQNEIGRCIRK
jgi:hypothetical protein